MSRLSGVGTRLGLALLVVLAGALALVYAIVVPSLRNRLVDSRLDELSQAAPRLARDLPANRFLWPDFLETAATTADARAVVFAYVEPPSALIVVGDSRGSSSGDVAGDKLALQAVLSGSPSRGTLKRGGTQYAEAAAPVPDGSGTVLLLSSSLGEVNATVVLTRNRLVVAGLLALAAAFAVGYVGSWLFARRLRRLEHAAERIAAGSFEEPVADAGTDELGQLARTFDRMRERLAALDHARREFIANASHELRTPLFSLGGFLELLGEEELDEETRRGFLVTMREQVDRLGKLASELLDLSRVDAGRLHVEREPVDLAELAETVVAEFAAVALVDGRPLAILSDGAAPALGDEQRVLQVGRILVENALVHTPPGVPVEVRATAGALAVEDCGPGIPPDQVPHVFDRFYRVEGRVSSGSGLGLAIARELARLMGGAVEVESEPGRTVFTLRLPVAEPASASEERDR